MMRSAQNRMSMLSLVLLAATHCPGVVHAQAAGPALAANVTVGELTEGDVRRIDRDNRKVTIKHGEIKGLDMPPMTMVFQVKDAAMLDKLKPGAKVLFRAASEGGTMTVTEIEAVR